MLISLMAITDDRRRAFRIHAIVPCFLFVSAFPLVRGRVSSPHTKGDKKFSFQNPQLRAVKGDGPGGSGNQPSKLINYLRAGRVMACTIIEGPVSDHPWVEGGWIEEIHVKRTEK